MAVVVVALVLIAAALAVAVSPVGGGVVPQVIVEVVVVILVVAVTAIFNYELAPRPQNPKPLHCTPKSDLYGWGGPQPTLDSYMRPKQSLYFLLRFYAILITAGNFLRPLRCVPRHPESVNYFAAKVQRDLGCRPLRPSANPEPQNPKHQTPGTLNPKAMKPYTL